MRKNILFIVICLFLFTNVCYADVGIVNDGADHELLYDIEQLYFNNGNEMVLEGWAFLHNYHNVGSDFSNATWGNMKVNTLRKKNVSIEIYFADENGIRLENGNFNVISGYNLEERTVDLTDWMCYRNPSNNLCYQGSIYYDLGFKATIDLNSLSGDFSKDYYIYLDYSLSGIEEKPGPRKISIVKSVEVYDENTVPENIEINGLSTKVKQVAVFARKLGQAGTYSTYCGGAGANNYWGVDSSYSFNSVIRKKNICSDGSFPATVYNYPIRLYKIGDYYAAAGWVSGTGSISLRFKVDSDKFCPSQNGNGVITDCNGWDKYRCDSLMTVTAKEGEIEYKADVLLREVVDLYLDDDYTNITLGSGNGFDFEINYVDTVTFEIKDRHYDSLNKDNLIFKELLVKYYKYKVKYNDKYFNKKNSFQDMLNSGGLVISDKFLNVNFSGSWKCDDVELDVEGNIGTIIQKCSFKLENAYYNYSTGNIEYGNLKNSLDNDNIFMLTSGAYYIPINFCYNSVNRGRYEWKVTSGGKNLSTMKVQVSEDEIIDLSFSVDTLLGENNRSCFINFENHFYYCDDDGAPGTGDGPFGPGSSLKYNFVYRSISVNEPFPSGNIYDNWSDFSKKYNGFDRINNSYDENNLEYKTKDLSIELLKDLKKFDYSYTEFDLSDIKKIVNGSFFDSVGTGCSLGEWADDWGTGCDVIK